MEDTFQDAQLSDSACPCLNCGYDLRAAIEPGAGEIRCPECGATNHVRTLRRHGLRAAAAVQLLALILVPPAALLLSAWLFALWSHTSVHTLLCLILAPVVIVAHSYAIWQLTEGTIVLTRSRMCWLKAMGIAGAVVIDLASCAAVGRWFL